MAREHIAHVEDYDEEAGAVVQGSGQYARSIAPGSPGKTKANSKSRREKTTKRPSASPPHALTDSDDTIHPVVSDKRDRDRDRDRDREREREKERERRAEERDAAAAAAADKEARREEKRRQQKKEQERAARHADRERSEREREQRDRAASKKTPVRPSARPGKTAPVVHTQQADQYRRPRFEDDASQYGIQPAQGPRPRAMSNRPSSYYGPGSRPPTSNKQWHAAQAISPPFVLAPNSSPFAPSLHAPPHASQHASSPFAPAPMPLPMAGQSPFAPDMPYAPPAWGPGAPYPMQPPPPLTPTDYFPPTTPMASSPQHSNLARRFQQRPSSAMGHRTMSSSSLDYDDYGPTYEQENIVMPQSLKFRDVEDRKLMPPPPQRSRTTVPPRQALRPPPPQRQIASRDYESDDYDGGESMYQEIVPQGYEYDDGVVSRPRSHRRGSSTYSRDGYQIEPAPAPHSSRRHSYMAGGESGSFSQSKYDSATAAALAYQNGVSGAAVPLTAAALSKAEKKSKSSRSSGSSGSRDESDYRRSATTRTTRSSTGDGEDITIKVTGHAVLRVGNAEIQCQDGGEINISQSGRLGGSDRASTIYSDDRRSRMERLPIRARSPSQSDSYSRSHVDGYEYPRIPFT
ncbi:hypothetical protein CH63R_13007 [Colletotrichum higginsianum IMI 349063]|uniref:Uncharacterized protein n=3 Tax=Colletotrichum higginsianum TaxID=80884 RepID=A0A1B7XVW7_COLHI|nr:hypothetical protein CH63R_13007 [Colletotrichum higginsianum IMI 349063]OBR03880.1 hypothetical protein CH63R_13007 [Colletotrichum higginsianum IMI 349063]TIC90648.1 hypothetical protein CH35J_011578 [Colletotrichum higginsianum]GJD03748.1 hypothetical protein ColKHC_12573 [Colletotrichum higginsianum]